MEFDIWNNKERKVLCVRNDYDGMMVGSHNHHLLEIGKEYTVENVEVHSWHTIVYLKEFPNKKFNSVVFEEIAEQALEQMKAGEKNE